MTAIKPAAGGPRQRENKHYSPVPDPVYTPTEPGFLVDSYCGRQWFVPLTAVGRDYAEFLQQADKLTTEQAQAQSEAHRESWPTWFAEQCNLWVDIERLGWVVRRSSRFKTKAALDNLRSSTVRDYIEVNIPSGG